MALVWNGYGKARVRMLRLERRGDIHEIKISHDSHSPRRRV